MLEPGNLFLLSLIPPDRKICPGDEPNRPGRIAFGKSGAAIIVVLYSCCLDKSTFKKSYLHNSVEYSIEDRCSSQGKQNLARGLSSETE